MSRHYLNCRCLGNHTGSDRHHHSDISIHTGYMILACQPSVVLASILQVVVHVSESAPEEMKCTLCVSSDCREETNRWHILLFCCTVVLIYPRAYAV